jgi:hypothetical protein
MLETQCSRNEQDRNKSNLSEVDFAFHDYRSTFALLPESSNVSGGSSRVAADEIARTHGAGDVGAFGEMLPLVAGGKDAAVTARCWSTPSGYFASLGSYGQRPASVNEFDGTPTDFVLSEDIDDSYEFFSHLNSGKPKEQQRQGTNQGHSWKRSQSICEALAHEDYQPRKSHDCDAGHRNSSSGAGSEYLHAMSLACNEEVLS